MPPTKSTRRAHDAEWRKLTPAERRAWINLLNVHRRVTARLDAALAEQHGLALAEWDALVRLAPAEDGMRMRDLADLVLLSPSGLTRLVDRLHKRDLVERRPGREDARETYVTISRSGLELLARAAPAHNEALRTHFLAPLTAREVGQLADILEKVAAAHGNGYAGHMSDTS